VVGAAEDELDRPDRHPDGVDPRPRRVVDVDVAGGDDDVALGIGGEALSALAHKQPGIREAAVVLEEGRPGGHLGLAGQVHAVSRPSHLQAEGADQIAALDSPARDALDEPLGGREVRAAVRRQVVVGAREQIAVLPPLKPPVAHRQDRR
jgi:hypothetical protein